MYFAATNKCDFPDLGGRHWRYDGFYTADVRPHRLWAGADIRITCNDDEFPPTDTIHCEDSGHWTPQEYCNGNNNNATQFFTNKILITVFLKHFVSHSLK